MNKLLGVMCLSLSLGAAQEFRTYNLEMPSDICLVDGKPQIMTYEIFPSNPGYQTDTYLNLTYVSVENQLVQNIYFVSKGGSTLQPRISVVLNYYPCQSTQ
jgi:hypothetical protein